MLNKLNRVVDVVRGGVSDISDELILSPLEFDSDFFGFPVWRLTVKKANSLDANVLKCGEELVGKGNYGGVCYVFLSSKLNDDLCPKLLELGGAHYGSLVEYSARVEDVPNEFDDSGVVVISEISDELCDLAVGSGVYSRFAKDVRFSTKYRDLYIKWLENCLALAKQGDGVILCEFIDDRLIGMVAVSVKEEKAKVELISVAEAYRMRGVGKRLIYSAFAFAKKKKCHEIVVNTQGENMQACYLYEACGFLCGERSEVWHLAI